MIKTYSSIIFALGCFLISLYSAGAQAPSDLVELDLGISKNEITGATPGIGAAAKPPHLREEARREPFMVLPGLKNLAYFRPVSGSSAPARGDLDQITDGLIKTDEFDVVEGPAWVQVNLGQPSEIHAIVLWHFYRNPVIYNDVIVQVADDAAFSRNVRTLFNNDHDNSAGLGQGSDTAYISRRWGEIMDARGRNHEGTTGGFVRVYTAPGMNGEPPMYVEIAVYGK